MGSGEPVVVQGTALASPYDHTTESSAIQPSGAQVEGRGEQQVCR